MYVHEFSDFGKQFNNDTCEGTTKKISLKKYGAL
jgi:hypothetical protein